MGGSTYTTRFGLVFYSDTSNAEKGMGSISRRLDNISAQLRNLSGMAEKASGSITGFLGKMGSSFVDTAARLEMTQTKFQFAFRKMSLKEQEERWDAVQTAGLKLVQTTDAVAESMALLQQMTSADVFSGKATKALKELNPQMTNFAELFGDMASASQFGERSAVWGLKALLQGEFGSAKRHLDQIGGKMNEYKKAMGGAKTEADKLVKIMPLLYRDYGGASQKMGSTWQFMVNQLSDIQDKLFSTFGKPMMDAMKEPLKAFLDLWTGEPDGLLLPANIKKLDGVKNIFKSIGFVLNLVGKELAHVVKGVVSFVSAHPALVKIGLTILGIVAAIGTAVAIVLAIKAAAMLAFIAFSGWSLPIMAVVGGLVAVGYWLLKANLGSVNLFTTWTSLKWMFAGVSELISSMNNGIGEISQKTMKELEWRGLDKSVITIGKFMFRVSQFFSGLVQGFKDNAGELWQAIAPILNRLNKWLGGLGMGAHEASSSWKSMGFKIADAFTMVAKVIGYAIDKVMGMIELVKAHPIIAMYLAQKTGLADNSITRNPISSYIMGSNAGWFAKHPLLAYAFARGSGIIPGKDKSAGQGAAGGAGGAMGGAASGLPVFVTNWPGGGVGGAGGGGEGSSMGGSEGRRALFDASTLTWLAGAWAAWARGKLLWAIAKAIAGALPTVLAAGGVFAALATWTVGTMSQLLKSDWWKIKQLSPEQAKEMADKAQAAEADASSHRSSGMNDTIAKEKAMLAARRNGAGNPVGNIIINVDGKKLVEKRVEQDADRTGRGGDVTSVP